jgi:hypothetical protein
MAPPSQVERCPPNRVNSNRRITRRTPGRLRTRILTQGVTPSLHVYYKSTRIKQYHNQQRALRTETTINNTYDFAVGKRLHNLPKLRDIGFRANRRLLEVERLSYDCLLAEESFQRINGPVERAGKRGLRTALRRSAHPCPMACLDPLPPAAKGLSQSRPA